MLKVKGHTDLYRDEDTKAILVTSDTEYNKYKTQKQIREQNAKEISTLKTEVTEIKLMLNAILEKISG